MSVKIPRVIENKLKFLQLTRAGKMQLCPFKEKALYHALNRFQRNFDSKPKYIFNTFMGLVLLETQRLKLEPDWTILEQFPSFDSSNDMTFEGEKLNMKLCHDICNRFKPKKYEKSQVKKNGPTFLRSVTYWKHGKEYKYPDQALDHESDPCRKDPNYKERIAQNDPIRLQLDPQEELRKAIKDPNIDKKGLEFLQRCGIQTNLTSSFFGKESHTSSDKQKEVPGRTPDLQKEGPNLNDVKRLGGKSTQYPCAEKTSLYGENYSDFKNDSGYDPTLDPFGDRISKI